MTCRVITTANERDLPYLPSAVAYKLSTPLFDQEPVPYIHKAVAEKTVSCFQSKEELLNNPLYKHGLALHERLDMTTVADVRPMALLHDWVLERDMAGMPFGPQTWRNVCQAALCLIPPRTDAVVTAIEESGFMEPPPTDPESSSSEEEFSGDEA